MKAKRNRKSSKAHSFIKQVKSRMFNSGVNPRHPEWQQTIDEAYEFMKTEYGQLYIKQ